MAEEPGKYEFLIIVLDTILHFYNTSTYPMFVDKITDSIYVFSFNLHLMTLKNKQFSISKLFLILNDSNRFKSVNILNSYQLNALKLRYVHVEVLMIKNRLLHVRSAIYSSTGFATISQPHKHTTNY
jgi:hypothetical protein